MSVFSRVLNKFNSAGMGARLVRLAPGAFAINVIGAGLAFGLNLLLARILGVSGYGTYVYVITWINFLMLIVVLGFDTTTLKFVPQYIAKKKLKLAYGYIVRSKQIALFSSLFFIIAMIGYLQIEKQNLETRIYQVFIIGLALLPIRAIIQLNGKALQALHRLLLSLAIQVILPPLLIAAGVIFAFTYLNNKEIMVEMAMLSNLLSALVVVSCLSLYLKRSLAEVKVGSGAEFNTRKWLTTSLPLMLNSGFYVVLAQGDILIIGYLLNTEQVGFYAAANKIALLVIFVLTAVNAVAAPMISQLYGEGNMQKLQRIVTISARITFTVSLPICLILIVFNESILSMFGEEFTQAGVVLAILASAQVISAITGSVGYILILTDHQNRAVMILAGATVINIALNFILIPIYGIIGAAIATVTSTLIWNILMYISTYRLVGVDSTIIGYKKIKQRDID